MCYKTVVTRISTSHVSLPCIKKVMHVGSHNFIRHKKGAHVQYSTLRSVEVNYQATLNARVNLDTNNKSKS